MKNKGTLIAWIALVAWMILIFFMSNQPGDVSAQQSELVLKLFSIIGIELSDKFGEFATFIVRKGAHFSEYFILYFLAFNVLKRYIATKSAIIYPLVLVILYAISDEIHQYFIPGRVMAIKDVLIDSSGGTVALIINYLFIKSKEKVVHKVNYKSMVS